ncbi:MAG: pitrilysin family protein, partial [Candidatus Babeliales bacterium]
MNTKSTLLATHSTKIQKKTLDNGMTILVKEVPTIPKVSLQIWYNVGSKDEKNGEKGIAHLIEHMIFKGTQKLSESDINMLTHKLSGYCNAFTSYDYTGYLFNFPTHHWKEILPVVADCMLNCSFKDDMLNSEMKAVIQELKMYKDNYQRSLMQELISTIFTDHPYHYPIIGYKRDLWNVSSNDLRTFYKNHYLPNNATLVVVGDVQADEVFELAEQFFGSIPANMSYKKDSYHFTQDIGAKTVTMYRDIKQPFVAYSFIVPGIKEKKDHFLQIIQWVIGKGKSSRLYKKLVDELKLATSVEVGAWDLFDHSIFFIFCEPTNEENIGLLEKSIIEEINDLIKNGVTDKEMNRAIKQAQMSLYSLLEDTEEQASQIACCYLATGDENYAFNYLKKPFKQLKAEIEKLINDYLSPTTMHKGMVLPLPEQEKSKWISLQQKSDEEDKRILSVRPRTSAVEAPSYACGVSIKEPTLFNFPKAKRCVLSNGLKLLFNHNAATPKVNLILEFKARHYYDPDNKQGLCNFVSKMLQEGTENYTGQQLANIVEARGMRLNCYPGGIAMSMLNEDLLFGLEILEEILNKATFEQQEIEKIRSQILTDIKCFWDEPRYFAGQLIKEKLYKDHPYSKNYLGTKESISQVTQKDLMHFYQQCINPHGAKLAIVGNIENYDLPQIIEQTIGKWRRASIDNIKFPPIARIKK